MLAATIARSAQDAPVQALLEWIADARRASWQRAALLRGAEVAWLGAPIPGSSGRTTGSAAVCITTVSDVSGRSRWSRRRVRVLDA